MTNRLADSTSPYLRQHADNPVHWQEWTPAALAEAARRDVPILLSVGYAACHWCHVMAHESFADDEVAAVLKEIEPGRKVILARGACDDKGQVMTFIEAMRATLAETGDLPIGLTILVEGEEESGSVNLPGFIKANAAELKADYALVCDTSMWDRDTPAISAGLISR